MEERREERKGLRKMRKIGAKGKEEKGELKEEESQEADTAEREEKVLNKEALIWCCHLGSQKCCEISREWWFIPTVKAWLC